MKPTPIAPANAAPMLAFGAHPDDIEFGCGGIIAKETLAGRAAHFVICSRGESASHGTPGQRAVEAEKAASILGVTVEFIELDGDAHLEVCNSHTIRLARIIRLIRPSIILAPSAVENQHPDHSRLGRMVRDAARLARYGGLAELRDSLPHSIESLFFYASSSGAEPKDITPIFIDVSDPKALQAWKSAMEAHASQTSAREYVEHQLARARVNGLSAGVSHAIALFPNDPIVVDSLSQLSRSARRF